MTDMALFPSSRRCLTNWGRQSPRITTQMESGPQLHNLLSSRQRQVRRHPAAYSNKFASSRETVTAIEVELRLLCNVFLEPLPMSSAPGSNVLRGKFGGGNGNYVIVTTNSAACSCGTVMPGR